MISNDNNSIQQNTQSKHTHSDNYQEIQLLNHLNKKGLGTDWNLGNSFTLLNWLNIASLYLLILDIQISYYRNILNQITVVGLIFSTITSTVSLSQFSITDVTYPTLSLILKMGFSATSIFTTIATGALKIMKIQENLESCLDFYKKWNKFASEISGQIQLPKKIRKNALSIIIRLKSEFKELFTRRLPLTKKTLEIVSEQIGKKELMEKFQIDTNQGIDLHTFYINNKAIITQFKRCCRRSSKKTLRYIEKHHLNNRISVYYIYQEMIKSELEEISKIINSKSNHRVTFKIDATNIRCVDYEQVANNKKQESNIDEITKKIANEYRNKSRYKSTSNFKSKSYLENKIKSKIKTNYEFNHTPYSLPSYIDKTMDLIINKQCINFEPECYLNREPIDNNQIIKEIISNNDINNINLMKKFIKKENFKIIKTKLLNINFNQLYKFTNFLKNLECKIQEDIKYYEKYTDEDYCDKRSILNNILIQFENIHDIITEISQISINNNNLEEPGEGIKELDDVINDDKTETNIKINIIDSKSNELFRDEKKNNNNEEEIEQHENIESKKNNDDEYSKNCIIF
jgi:hypothetical protein